MTTLAILSGILGALLIGAMSPGPSFVLISRTALVHSRKAGLAAALGMGVGGIVYAILALVGLIALLQQVEILYVTLKICGGLYLLYLAYRIWRGASESVDLAASARDSKLSGSVLRAFLLGLATHVANPKTAVVYASIFAVLLPADPSWVLLAILPLGIFCVEMGWYGVVALVFSASGPQRVYLRSKSWIDRIAGAVMGTLGAKLIAEEVR